MKKTLLTVLLAAAATASDVSAQTMPEATDSTKEFIVRAASPETPTGIHVNAGDTVYLDANGNFAIDESMSANASWKTHYSDGFAVPLIKEEGFPSEMSRAEDNKYDLNATETDLHAGLVVVVTDDEGNTLCGSQYADLPEVPYAMKHQGMRAFRANCSGTLKLDLNTLYKSKSVGKATVRFEQN